VGRSPLILQNPLHEAEPAGKAEAGIRVAVHPVPQERRQCC
jgi:hypothetical protein